MRSVGFVQTVLGPSYADDLGVTLTHEHVLVDMLRGASSVAEMLPLVESSGQARIPEAGWDLEHAGGGTAASWLAKWTAPITLENLADVQRNPFYYGHVYRLLDVDDAIYEVRLFKLAGGSCIVDGTVTGMARDPLGLQRISRATGVHLVMTAGYYEEAYHPPELRDWSEDEVLDRLLREVREGVAGVFPGMLKAALHYPILPGERKVLRAAARAQAATGLALTVHPGMNPAAPIEAVHSVEEAGGDPTRTVLQHLDHRLFDLPAFLEVARTGCYLSLDGFGREASYRQRGPIDLPNDATRLNHIAGLADHHYARQILISHDVASKRVLHKWGGLGYDHILINVVPLMRYKGFSQELIEQIVVKNPAEMLTIGRSSEVG